MSAIVTTPRLVIREFTEADVEDVYRLHTDKDVMRYTGEPMPETLELVREITVTRIIPYYREHGYGRWAVVRSDTSKLIGWSGLKYLDELGEIDIGYRFFTDQWGQGFGTESARAIVEYGFASLGLKRIIGLVLRDNVGSIRVLEKAGLKYANVVDYCGDEALRYVIDVA